MAAQDPAPASPAALEPRTGPLRLSVVVPMYNEAASADAFFDALLPILAAVADDFEVVCVDDGSRDATVAVVLARQGREPRIRLVALSRNFGKEAALSAALDHCAGDAVVAIDADLQMPPRQIAAMVAKWREGWDVVAATRDGRDTDGRRRGFFSRQFYLVYNRIADTQIPPETGDFRLMDRAVVDALRRLPESNRFMKGLFAWVGFRVVTIPYTHGERQSGISSFRMWKLWNFALDGITGFSSWPLRVWSYIGFGIALLSFLYAIAVIVRTLLFGSDVPGYASLMTVVLFLGGIQLLTLGIIGEYIGRIMIETKRRPVYLVRRRWGFGDGVDGTGEGPGAGQEGAAGAGEGGRP
jgi:glycosyltransferase involved in cell wall biosynthesis